MTIHDLRSNPMTHARSLIKYLPATPEGTLYLSTLYLIKNTQSGQIGLIKYNLSVSTGRKYTTKQIQIRWNTNKAKRWNNLR